MIKDRLYYENRINILSNRNKINVDNTKIIKKLQRQLRKITAEN